MAYLFSRDQKSISLRVNAGLQRFRIKKVQQEKPIVIADVELFDDKDEVASEVRDSPHIDKLVFQSRAVKI